MGGGSSESVERGVGGVDESELFSRVSRKACAWPQCIQGWVVRAVGLLVVLNQVSRLKRMLVVALFGWASCVGGRYGIMFL